MSRRAHDIALALTAVLQFHCDTKQDQVIGASLIVWMAAQQGIEPDSLGADNTREFLESLVVLSKKSRDIEGLELTVEIGETSLGRQWRQIRLKALQGLL